eukprot:12697609-Prorocentrum_lima.AAC.1
MLELTPKWCPSSRCRSSLPSPSRRSPWPTLLRCLLHRLRQGAHLGWVVIGMTGLGQLRSWTRLPSPLPLSSLMMFADARH